MQESGKVMQAVVLCAEAQIMINISHESIMRKNLAAEWAETDSSTIMMIWWEQRFTLHTTNMKSSLTLSHICNPPVVEAFESMLTQCHNKEQIKVKKRREKGRERQNWWKKEGWWSADRQWRSGDFGVRNPLLCLIETIMPDSMGV